MKKITLIALVALFSSCGNETPLLNGNNPFIVSDIEKYNETHSKYYSEIGKGCGADNFLGSWHPAIILPTGLYNIGDTISIINQTKQ